MTTDSAPPLLGGLSARAFLAEYWQRKPLLIRQAMPGFQSPLQAEELAGLAMEPDIESRLVLEHEAPPGGAEAGWELRHGPFTEADFTSLPAARWTLLLQDMEKFLPDLVEVLDRFRFIPDWRIDDLMISHAAPGGSVGPHRDNYDVFLLQAHGRRRWLLDQRTDVLQVARDDLPLQLLAGFQATDSWVLEPGDMLYLPPGVPHHGIALDPCQTWSIGFRAPRLQDLLGDVLHRLMQRFMHGQSADAFYQDPGRAPAEHPAMLDPHTLGQVRALVREALLTDDQGIDRWFASHVTEPKAAFADKAVVQQHTPRALLRRMTADGPDSGTLIRNPASRIALLAQSGQHWLYADGQEQAVSGQGMALLRVLTQQRRIALQSLAPLCDNLCDNQADDSQNLSLLADLINAGHWYFAEDEE